MTTLHEGLYSKLSTDAGVIALASTRTYPMSLPYNPTLPAITYQDVSMRTEQQFGSTAMKVYRIQINCWGVSHDAATDLADAVIAALGRTHRAPVARGWPPPQHRSRINVSSPRIRQRLEPRHHPHGLRRRLPC